MSSATARCKLREAPVFHPSLEEFSEPYTYIAKIRPIAEPFGICKIVAPKTPQNERRQKADFPSSFQPDTFEFVTKLQSIHQLQKRPGPNMLFLKKLVNFLKEKKNIRLTSVPKIEGREVDLYNLFHAVLERGGFEEANKIKGRASTKTWKEVAKELRLSASEASAQQLAACYSQFLADFEGTYTKKRKHSQMDAKPSETCEVCRSSEKQDTLLLCEDPTCRRCFHMQCLTPPLVVVPRGEWLCDSCTHRCMEGTKHAFEGKDEEENTTLSFFSDGRPFGFGEGGRFKLAQFKKWGDAVRRAWFGHLSDAEYSSLSSCDVEEEYWRVVESAEQFLQVHYGSDLNSIVVGSGFDAMGPLPKPHGTPPASDAQDHEPLPESSHSSPRPATLLRGPQVEVEAGAEGAADMDVEKLGDLWDLNVLPTTQGSVLSYVSTDIPGVKTSMLYIGMMFSTFCWHNEDCYLPSIAFLHTGAPKTWYGVPGGAAEHFEAVMKAMVPRLFENDPDLLFHLVTMLSPHHLCAQGVPVCHTIQQPGDYIVTFPAAYHAGFSHGFNCGESVNFAFPEWLPWGAKAVERYKLSARPAALSIDMIVHRMAANASNLSPTAAQFVANELRRMRNEEKVQRTRLHKEGVRRSELVDDNVEKGLTEDDVTQCSTCNHDCYLSCVVCDCRPHRAVCLRHADKLCSCPVQSKRMVVRLTLGDLDKLICAADSVYASRPQQKEL